MMRTARTTVTAAALLAMLLSTAGCNRLKARDQLNKGVQAYKSAQYEAAIGHFQQAVNLDPTLPMARLYLATAYAQQVIPNADTPENLKYVNLAIDSYQKVLQEKPNDVNSLKGIASLYFNTKQFDKAKDYNRQVIAADPNDAEAYYTIGVIDWTIAYKNAIPIRTGAGLKDDGAVIKDKAACAKIQEQNATLVNEGLDALNKAIQIRPNYDDAMQYLNLMTRRKGDIDCPNADAVKADMDAAANWNDKAMGARKANEAAKEKSENGGITQTK